MVYTEPTIDFAAMHKECREKVFAGMKAADIVSGVALLKGGEPTFRYATNIEITNHHVCLTPLCSHDTDHEHLFRQESHFFYLFGINEPDLYGLLDFTTGLSHLFIPRLGVEYEVWCGKIVPPAGYAAKYGIDHVHFSDELLTPQKQKLGVNSDSKRAIVKVDVSSELKGSNVAVDESIFYKVMVDSRSIKSPLDASYQHARVVGSRPRYEELQTWSHGIPVAATAYTCICGCGPNGAVLHYGHAGAPNDKKINDGEMCLLDMGAEFRCYASDITCSYPSNGKFTQKQRGIYNTVLSALLAVRNNVREGVEWVDMHLLAERKIVEVWTLTDVGGYPEGSHCHARPGLSSLRMNRALKAGMVLTNEPGCYFIEALLVPAVHDPVKGAHLYKKLILEEYLNFGGVRLEEDLIITVDGCENMTNVPREIKD
ncbi:UNVERIFIED_CONTAM: hypothetical protein HDU68_001245 [Siphonaria sp. JEL0065]|nr:hypothetical protein HDU68_001245 [Siphonaria sp. JEL0065]